MENTDAKETTADENSLDELLDSSLSDFDKPLPKISVPVKESLTKIQSQPGSSGSAKPDAQSAASDSAAWNEEYKQFQDAMQNLLESDPSVNKEFSSFLDNLQSNAETGGDNFSDTFAEAIKGLTTGAQNIPDATPEELANMLQGLDFGASGSLDNDQIPDIMPMMQTVMQNLMSKELLYPSLKDIVDKYPDWLANKRGSLPEDTYENYNKQYSLMREVCEEFEQDCDGSDAAKKTRFEKVLGLMQKIQTYGNPPKELVGELGPGLPLDEHGNMQIPGMPEQCTIS